MLRIGLISFAHMHGWSYGRAFAGLPDTEVVAICDEDADRAEEAGRKLGVTNVHTDPERMLKAVDLDAVVVCSENAHHARHTVLAAEAGVHVLCEKPLATSPDEAVRMVTAARANHVHLMTAFPCRFHPAARRTHAALQGHGIGDVLAVNGTNHGKNPGGWFVDPVRSGGGAIADHTVHVVDLLRWMTGQEVTEVYAESTRFDETLPCEDGAILSLAFEDFVATLDCSWSNPPSNPVWGDVTLEVIGRGGTLSMNLFAQEMTVVTERDRRVAYENWGDNMDGALVREFVSAIREDRPPAVTGVDGLRAVEVVAAAYRSVGSGRPEAVEHRDA
jgi:predicted dehydrogenase